MASTNTLPAESIRTVYVTKASALVTITTVMWLVKWAVFPGVPAARYTYLMLLVLLPTVAIVRYPTSAPSSYVALGFATDIVAITIGTYFGGGVENTSGPLLYTLLIGLAGLVLSSRAALFTALWASSCYGLMIWAEAQGLLVHQGTALKQSNEAIAQVVIVGVYLFLNAAVVEYAVGQLRRIFRRAEEIRGEAVRALSHDLKNPLTVIQGYAEIADTAPSAERSDMLLRIQRSAQYAINLVHNVLDAAAEHGLTPHRQATNVREVVSEAVHLHELAAANKAIRLELAQPPTIPSLSADPQLVGRAIGNLLSNAIKFSDQGGRIRVSTTVESAHVAVAVTDSGPGIAAADHPLLFQPYGRPLSSQMVEGTGLGLYIVRRIAEAHGGNVEILSAPGHGSTFVFRLPLESANPSSSAA